MTAKKAGRARRGIFVQEGAFRRFRRVQRFLERRTGVLLTSTEALVRVLEAWEAYEEVWGGSRGSEVPSRAPSGGTGLATGGRGSRAGRIRTSRP